MVAGNTQIMAEMVMATDPMLEASFCKRKLNTGLTDSSRCSLLTRMLSTPSDPGHTTGTSDHWTSDYYHSSRTSTPTPPPSATLDHAPVGILQGYMSHEGSGHETTSTAERQKSALKFVCEDRDRSTHSERDSSDHGGGNYRFGPNDTCAIRKWAMQFGSLANGKTLFTKHAGGRAADLTILDTSSEEEDDDDDDNNDDDDGFSNDSYEEDDKIDVNEIEQSTPRAFDDSDSDDGNASDDEAGFASSDGEEEDFFSSFVKQVDPPIANPKKTSNRHHNHCIEFGPSTPPRRLLPDSTDFVCGTLDEDQPLEAAFFCSKRSSVKSGMTLAHEIDPSFPDDEEIEHFNDDNTPARRGRQESNCMATTARPQSSRKLPMGALVRCSLRSVSPAPLANKRHRGAIDIVKSLENSNITSAPPRRNQQYIIKEGHVETGGGQQQQEVSRSYDGRRGLRIRVKSEDILRKTIREEDEYVMMDQVGDEQTSTNMDVDKSCGGNIITPSSSERVVSI